MKKILFFILILMVVHQFSFSEWQYDPAPDGKPWILSSVVYAADDNPNLDPDWDWRQTYYTVYWNRYQGTPTSVLSPFYSNVTGGVAFTLDFEPEDGWVLVYRDFGTSKYFVSNPYFILYNVYQGLLRVFHLVNSVENYTHGGVELFFDYGSPTTALLTHANHRAWATDNYKNHRFFSITDLVNYHWTYTDFIMAYDPATGNSSKNNSLITFKLLGVEVTDVKIDGSMNLVQQLPKSSIATQTGDVYEFGDLVTDGKKVLGYYNTFDKYKNDIKKAADKQDDPKIKAALSNLASSWVVKQLPYIGAAVGIVDLFIGGGREKNQVSPVPMVFDGSMELSGTLKTQDLIFKSTIQTPGTKHDTPNAIPFWDYPMGILNLTRTPVLLSRQYWQPEGPSMWMQYSSYKIKDDLEFAINSSYPGSRFSHLRLKYMEAALVFRFNEVYTYPYDLLPGINDWWEAGIYELESSANGKYVLRTRYMPYNVFKNTSIRVPPGTDVTIKIRAVLERIDNPDAQEVVFIADYEPVFEKDSGTTYFPWSSYQMPPEIITLQPINHTGKENYIYKYRYDDNYGASTAIQVGPDRARFERRSLIKFDTSSLFNVDPDKISSAVLKLYCYSFSGDDVSYRIYASRIKKGWAEGIASSRGNLSPLGSDWDYSDEGAGETWASAGLLKGTDYNSTYESSTVVSPGTQGKWINLTITNAVKAWIRDPSSNHGLVLFTNESDLSKYAVATFRTSDYTTDSSEAPIIMIYIC
ncbi:MAG: DNRLRE domain-containing protein [Spirochaetales bacterium]|nr:DNRLRE domain-containing protein [Spirochaetales bacterium]